MGLNQRALAIALAAAPLSLAVLALAWPPVWATNDDVALAMLGSGFGMALSPSSQMVFTHQLYGELLAALSWVAGPASHGWMTLASICLAAGLLAAALRAVPGGAVLFAACWLGLLVPAVLLPQFTITSGVLFGAAAAWMLSGQRHRAGMLLALLALVLCCLLRPFVALLGLGALAPLLLLLRAWQANGARRLVLASLVILAGLALLEWAVFPPNAAWQEAIQANRLRAVFTDFGRMPWIEGHPAYEAAGWTAADHTLFMSWYPFHPIFAPERLEALVRAVARPLAAPPDASWLAWFPVPLQFPALGAALLATVAVAAGMAGWMRVAAWFLGGAACLVLLGWSGRYPVERVWMALLAAAGFAVAVLPRRRAARGLMLALALLAGAWSAERSFHRYTLVAAEAQAYRAWFTGLALPPATPVVVWGAALAYEYLVPVLSPDHALPRPAVIAIGALSDSPLQREVRAALGVGDVSQRACREGDLIFVAHGPDMAQLLEFCARRMGGTPVAREVGRRGLAVVYAMEAPK